jgi:3-hydroxyacyl-[acyl-carrier-protein] dehydratase
MGGAWHRPISWSARSMMDINEIKKILPHRYPFLLVDRIVESDGESRIVGIKNVSANEPFFQGHFPDYPVMPGVLILEALGQVGCILGMQIQKKEGFPVIFFTGVDAARFRKPVHPGDQLRLELTKLKQRGDYFKFQANAYVGEQRVTEAVLQAMIGKTASDPRVES